MAKQRPKKRKASGSSTIKPPELAPAVNYDLRPPIFSLIHIAPSHCITECETEERAAFATRMRELSQLTWRQLKSADRRGQGFEKVNERQLRVGSPASITEDVRFIAFRFFGKARMIGFRAQDVFHVVWFDRAMDLYDHGR